MSDRQLLIRIDSAPASDNWGFVGRVLVGEHEAYRTIRAYATPRDALASAQRLMTEVLGPLLARPGVAELQRWVRPRAQENRVGLRPRSRHRGRNRKALGRHGMTPYEASG